MNKRSLTALIVLNLALLGGVAVTLLTPAPAAAQFGGGGQYLMLSGRAPGRESQSLVYVIDMRTSAIVALMVNTANNSFEVVDGRIVQDDLREGPARGR
jgi:hypothetical protein